MQRSLRRALGPCRATNPADAMTGPSDRLAPFGGSLAASRQEAFERARTDLAKLRPDEAARRTGASPRPDGVTVTFLGGAYAVDFAKGAVHHLSGVAPQDKLTVDTLILHYLLSATGAPLTGERASYREFPGAHVYYDPFRARTVLPIVKTFGSRPGDLVAAASAFGGRPVALGDGAVVIDVFPRLPVTFAVWAGDDEVPASASVLFDSSAPDYLPLEDLVIAASFTSMALCRAASKGGATGAGGGGESARTHTAG
jgi:hypothetical protein